MKKRKFLNRLISITIIPITICSLTITYGITTCFGQQANDKVFEAYDLRINGHADSAKVILAKVLSMDSTNAIAWYELCRTTQHLGLANPRAIKESIEEALRYINLAINCDPDNAWLLSYKGVIETLQFYLAIQMDEENAVQYLEKVEKTFNSVFQLDPSYYENKITLVEFFGGLPPEMGGDPEKAEKYAKELEDADLVSGAQAREILMQEDADYVSFWTEIVDQVPQNADANQALGRIYLFLENIDEATRYYQKAIDLDPSKNVLYLDLGRYYMMMAMQNPAIIDSVTPLIEKQFNKFLNFTPEPIRPMRAWAYGQLAMINFHGENAEAYEKYKEIAKELDPFFSKASGNPGMAMFCPLDVVIHQQGYYLSPF